MDNLYNAMVMAIEVYAEISGMTFEDVAHECKKMNGPVYRSVLKMVVMAK